VLLLMLLLLSIGPSDGGDAADSGLTLVVVPRRQVPELLTAVRATVRLKVKNN
jgi:hypothetical protein